MKKIILHCLLFTTCIAFATSCSKDVKAPAKVINNAAATKTTTTTTTTQTTTDQGGHTCPGHSYGGQ